MKGRRYFIILFIAIFLLQNLMIFAALSEENLDIFTEDNPELIALIALTVTDSAVELVWTSGANEIDAAKYDIYRDNSIIGDTASFTFSDLNLTPDTPYTYKVVAKDQDGNSIATSNEISITTTVVDRQKAVPDINGLQATDITDTTFIEINSQYSSQKSARFIIKYKNSISTDENINSDTDKIEEGDALKDIDKNRLSGLFNERLKKVQSIQGKNKSIYDVITLSEETTLGEFAAELNTSDAVNEIEYVQPDYEMHLSSFDPSYDQQWGLENSGGNTPDDALPRNTTSDVSILEGIRIIAPHIADMIENDPECLEFFNDTPRRELWSRIGTRRIPGDIPFEMFRELTRNPMFRDMLLHPDIAYGSPGPAIPEYLCDADVVPAWDATTGDRVTIAIIDTGIDITHEDLEQNIWVNPGEIPNDGIDDDGNGYVDDVTGWDFIHDDGSVHDESEITDEMHGTHIAGVIAAAKDNGLGIAGVAPDARILPLKVFENGTAHTSDIIRAINYASSMGVKIINCSWGSTDENRALEEVIESEPDILFSCAAGNSGESIDSNPFFPAAYDLDNVIAVASVGRNGILSGFSNYGEASVDVAAPGEDIMSAQPGNQYSVSSGTSISAAFVSGEAALLLGIDPELGSGELRERIVISSDKLSSLTGKVSGGGEVNCYNAVNDIKSDKIIQIEGYTDLPEYLPLDSEKEEYDLFSAPAVEGQFSKIAAGDYHSLALRNDGTVWACGANDYGQLGDGTLINRVSPVQVSGLYGITAIAAGQFYSLALGDDGTVWAWGENYLGQLGDGTTIDRVTPGQVSGLYGITAIAAGGAHSLALGDDGTVWAWGANDYGQLGDGTENMRTTPVQVGGLYGVTAITAGEFHSLALGNDGTVWAWGENYLGQLGDGTTMNRVTPVQVSGLTGIIAVSGGGYHNLAQKSDGGVWVWGDNSFGQLGDGTTTVRRTTPVQVSGLTGIIAIAGGLFHSLALKSDGMIWAWGDNENGQLGDGTITAGTITPVLVSGFNDAIAITGGCAHSLALKDDGTVWAWGSDYYGQLGSGIPTVRETPVKVNGRHEVTDIAAGGYHSLALGNDGTVWAWGGNYSGQLGDGTTIDRAEPGMVNGLNGKFTKIAAGYSHSLALKDDRTVWAWGNNYYGQLGDGTETMRTTPVRVGGLTGIVAVSGGGSHSLALKSDGTVWAWGSNGSGQLGDGTTIVRTTPVRVSGLTGIIAVSGGGYHSLALKSDGTVWAWGSNSSGQLGDGTTTSRTTPVQVSGLTGIIAVSGGGYHSLALKSDSTVWAWGLNSNGQLGDGTTTSKKTPVRINGIDRQDSVACGMYHSFIINDHTSVSAWGLNSTGQLGDGTRISKSTQVDITNGITVIDGGYGHSMAIKQDGMVWTWGDNSYGQLGNGEKRYSEYPQWSFGTPALDNPLSAELTANCTSGKVFDFAIKLQNIENFNERTFTVTYNTNDVAVVDLCAMTFEKELGEGPVQGAGITVVQNDAGIIKFTVDTVIPPGKTWSGTINMIKFNPKITGSTTLNCSVE